MANQIYQHNKHDHHHRCLYVLYVDLYPQISRNQSFLNDHQNKIEFHWEFHFTSIEHERKQNLIFSTLVRMEKNKNPSFFLRGNFFLINKILLKKRVKSK